MKLCHACKSEWEEQHPPGRMETCLHCSADMHCCLNCAFYEPHRSDGCSLRNIEAPADKERWCDCSEFRLADHPESDGSTPAPHEEAKRKFDALFKNDR